LLAARKGRFLSATGKQRSDEFVTDGDVCRPLPEDPMQARRVLAVTYPFIRAGARAAETVFGAPTPSFEALYREYFDFVWSSAARFGVESSAMDDLVQEVFIVIHAKRHTLENPGALRSWIYGIVRRTASNHRRARQTRSNASKELGIQAEARGPEPTPLDEVQRRSDLQLLRILLDELDAAKREVFALVELEELSVPQVAELLRIPLNTAYSRLRLARQAFDAGLARHARQLGHDHENPSEQPGPQRRGRPVRWLRRACARSKPALVGWRNAAGHVGRL
jgi:RNA polymerase sigma-70 factor (ECF subfamily)